MFLILIFIKIIINLNKNLIISVWIKPNQIHFIRIGFYENFGFCSIRSYSVRMLSRAIEHKKKKSPIPAPKKNKEKKEKKKAAKNPNKIIIITWICPVLPNPSQSCHLSSFPVVVRPRNRCFRRRVSAKVAALGVWEGDGLLGSVKVGGLGWGRGERWRLWRWRMA